VAFGCGSRWSARGLRSDVTCGGKRVETYPDWSGGRRSGREPGGSINPLMRKAERRHIAGKMVLSFTDRHYAQRASNCSRR
jgi:hypothetical protein